MKTGSPLLLSFTFCSLLLPGAVIAQMQQDTSTADSPYLRHAQSTPAPMKKVSDKDAQFIARAVGGNETEIENGKMAMKKAQGAEVKKIAARIVSDHTKMNNSLLAFAAKNGVRVTTGTVKPQNIGEKDFDREYVQMVEQAHQSDIADYEKQAKTGGDAELRSWATKNLPTLKAHLAMIRDALKRVK
jgi:putative membrane protein